MGAGRPYKSKTPVWHNMKAIKVRVYRYLADNGDVPSTKNGCAKFMKLSRTTVRKWWDVMEWSEISRNTYNIVWQWRINNYADQDFDRCAKELNIPYDDVMLQVVTRDNIWGVYYF